VNGIRAVHAGASVAARSGRLVATGGGGYLPDGIVRKAPLAGNATRLANRSAAAFAQQCADGAVLGRAVVPADAGSTYQDVPGFATSEGGPPSNDGTSCHLSSPQAERVSPGVYRARLSSILEQGTACAANLPADDAAVVVTARSDAGTPLIATYRPVCDSTFGDGMVDEVHITDATGKPIDATFAIELVSTGGVAVRWPDIA
jgi:hypothetical protein